VDHSLLLLIDLSAALDTVHPSLLIPDLRVLLLIQWIILFFSFLAHLLLLI